MLLARALKTVVFIQAPVWDVHRALCSIHREIHVQLQQKEKQQQHIVDNTRRFRTRRRSVFCRIRNRRSMQVHEGKENKIIKIKKRGEKMCIRMENHLKEK